MSGYESKEMVNIATTLSLGKGLLYLSQPLGRLVRHTGFTARSHGLATILPQSTRLSESSQSQ